MLTYNNEFEPFLYLSLYNIPSIIFQIRLFKDKDECYCDSRSIPTSDILLKSLDHNK